MNEKVLALSAVEADDVGALRCTCGHRVRQHPGLGLCETCDCNKYDPDARIGSKMPTGVTSAALLITFVEACKLDLVLCLYCEHRPSEHYDNISTTRCTFCSCPKFVVKFRRGIPVDSGNV